ncbi:MAG: flagellar hook-associated protein FlgK [Firmicutes bacterium]|nr:flagellar hook-associated protein FlgK [Bacillota bacterium]
MRSTFFGLDIARRALQAQQRALDVVGHNIANANTPGYSRQVAVLSTSPAYTLPSFHSPLQAGQVGTGVQVEAIRRLRDEFVEMQLRNETESSGRWEARYEALQQVELMIQEPSDLGLRDALDQFWQSLQDLHQQPESDAARAVVRERALALTAAFQHVHKQLSDLRADLDRMVGLEVQRINSLLERLADVNGQIYRVALSGQEPNDLLDQRDQLLLELAELADIHVTVLDNRMVEVSIGGLTVVDGNRAVPLVAEPDPANGDLLAVRWEPTGKALTITNGRLAGILEARDQLVAGYLQDLDTLAATIIVEFNNVHRSGYTLEDPAQSGGDFFTGTGAQDFGVHDDILQDLKKIAASASGEPGDGGNALELARIFEQPFAGLGGVSMDDYLRSFVSSVGVAPPAARHHAPSGRHPGRHAGKPAPPDQRFL